MTTIEPTTVRTVKARGATTRVVQAFAMPAHLVTKGDTITNVGVVDAVNRVGVFVVASVRGTAWSLATGTGDIATTDVIWHESSPVSIDVDPQRQPDWAAPDAGGICIGLPPHEVHVHRGTARCTCGWWKTSAVTDRLVSEADWHVRQHRGEQ